MKMQTKSDKAEKVLRSIMEETGHRFLPIIDSGDGSKGRLLEAIVKKEKPRLALEIGTLVGYSAIKIIRNLPSSGKLVTLEINPETAAEAIENLKEASMLNKAEVIIGSALKTIPKLKGKFDFIFIDAEKSEYMMYLQLLEKYDLLNKSAVIFADNAKVFEREMADYLAYMRNSGKYRSNFYDFGFDGVEVSEKI